MKCVMLVIGICRVLIDDGFKLSFGKFIKSIFKFNVNIVMSISFLTKGQCSKTEQIETFDIALMMTS